MFKIFEQEAEKKSLFTILNCATAMTLRISKSYNESQKFFQTFSFTDFSQQTFNHNEKIRILFISCSINGT